MNVIPDKCKNSSGSKDSIVPALLLKLVGARNIKGHPAAAISALLSVLGFVQMGRGIIMPRI